MKLRYIIAVLAIVAPAALYAEQGIGIAKADGETWQVTNSRVKSLTFDGDNAVLTSADGQTLIIARADVVGIAPVADVAAQYTVTYAADGVSVVNPFVFDGVTTEIDGSYVVTNNANTAEELTFVLTGESNDGGYVYNGSYKCTLGLSDLSLTSTRGAAIDIVCGKRIAVQVTGTCTLADCREGEQKGCLHFKGHPEFTGGGTLNVSGYTKHAVSTKEYLQLKKSFGTLNVLYAEADGIHAGQYFQANGGKVKVSGVKGDGLQVEATDTPDDESNGEIIIKGGSFDIEVTGDDSDCIKADSTITITGGKFTLRASGSTSKGIKAKRDIYISDVDIDAKMTGNGIVVATDAQRAPGGGGWPGGPGGPGGGGWPGGWDKEDQETSSPGCIKADGDLVIASGTLNLSATGKGGKCLNAEGSAAFGAIGTDGPTITASTTGGPVSGSGENLNGQPKAVKVYGNLVIDSGVYAVTTTGQGGEGIECKSYLTINGGVVSCQTYDDGINAGSKITINGGVVYTSASNNDDMDCNGSEGFEFNGGIILASGSNTPEEGFDCDNYRFVIKGGTIIGTGGASSSVTSASQPYSLVSGQSITANQYLSIQDTSGNVICSYKVPKSLNATVLVSCPEFVSGSTYRLVRNSSAVSNPTATYLDGRFTIGGTLTGGTSSSITPRTK